MIHFFRTSQDHVIALEHPDSLCPAEINRLCWLFNQAVFLKDKEISGLFIGPRVEMITPWSTNAVEISQNMGISKIRRIEEFIPAHHNKLLYDRMLQHLYEGLGQELFSVNTKADVQIEVDDLVAYNLAEGLALSEDEIEYLMNLSGKLRRKLTDSEVFGFSQVNSEHCRHKIFNGRFILDGVEMPETLFGMIKKTSRLHPDGIVSAYTDNVAFVDGPVIQQFAPDQSDAPGVFRVDDIDSVISLKAETHNFPTTVEPFNGAATGSGGEIRDRMAGGKGSIPLAGTAVYMTSYPRPITGRGWEKGNPRPWLYQSPLEILIKASNGASDFGNKFGQPLICGSVLTFEQSIENQIYAYDKVIMLAGGIGYARRQDSMKDRPSKGDKIIVLGGDNYRIGMGGGAVSSVATGEYGNQIELNAVQRSNPEMQKRVYNAIRALCECATNPVISIHDHGAGGHLNSLSELMESTGGIIDIFKLPVGDPTLSDKEIIGNESQERMGLVMSAEDAGLLKRICERERAPYYEVGEVSDDGRLVFWNSQTGHSPIDLQMEDLFGKPPRTILADKSRTLDLQPLHYAVVNWLEYLEEVLQLEAVACKDWLTNKVDRSVTGRVAMQQTAGEIQLPVNNLGICTLDYKGIKGIGTALGHAPGPALVRPEAGSRLAVAEALTNLVWAPLEKGLAGVSLSANWMWPARQPGEDYRLYAAVKALSDFCIGLGINVPTGKDSLSMTQKYPDGSQVISPGTVIVTAVAQVSQVRQAVTPVLKAVDSALLFIDFSLSPRHLGGSSLAQALGQCGNEVPDVADPQYFSTAFTAVQELIREDLVLAGHDVSAGGLITCLLEMCFPQTRVGAAVNIDQDETADLVQQLFSEIPAVIIQVDRMESVKSVLAKYPVKWKEIGQVLPSDELKIKYLDKTYGLNIQEYRNKWYRTSYLLDRGQCGEVLALERYRNYGKHLLTFRFPPRFSGTCLSGQHSASETPRPVKAAIIREKGVNGDREMAYSLYHAGFEVRDVHMTDLISGRETLDDIHMIVFVGGFSNSDVLGSAKGWAGAFLFNEKAKASLDNFFARNDTLSLGVCNGCQLMMELGLLYPGNQQMPLMRVNDSGKFESQFLTVEIPDNESVMLKSLSGSRLGIWVAHGEGKFVLPGDPSKYRVVAHYAYSDYPANPNGSEYDTAALVSEDGRHLAMMPHLERSLFPWQWAEYPFDRKQDEVTPWLQAFENARSWIENHKSE